MSDYAIHGDDLTAIANAIRQKTGSSALLEVDQFATAIATIPSANLPSNFTKFTSGTFTPTENVHNYTITHGLGQIPDLVLVYPVSGSPDIGGPVNGCLLAGREMQSITGNQWYSYGTNTFDVNMNRSPNSIYNPQSTGTQGLKEADAQTMTICSYHGANYCWGQNITYRWLAFAQDID